MIKATVRIALVALLVGAMSMPSSALEKVSRTAIDTDDWSSSTTGTIRYYNNCTGWVWVWSGWSAGETMGVQFASFSGFLNVTWALTFSGVPAGYGFTGTISAVGGHNCASPTLASQPYLPPATAGWNATAWGGLPVPSDFMILISWGAASGFTNSSAIASDHPFAGPTGPTACGNCFPSTRVSHSRYFGVAGAYCPSGTTLSDGLCDIEFMLDANVKGGDIVVDDSWGKVKALYR
ncbi:MAG TPA: hypothetical protein VKU85_09215 [bacterium]|nr:hypothetical protein [bacterium]